MKCQNKNFYMRNNSTCGNSLYLGILYHFKPKTQKKFFDKKNSIRVPPLHFFKNHKNPYISRTDDPKLKIPKDLNSTCKTDIN